MGITLEPIFRAPMGRILDVVGIGGMKTGMGRFSSRVADPLCPWNNAVWQFETVEGVLQVTSTEGSDCNLSIQALAALVYGTHDPGDFAIRGWGDPSPEVQGTMRRMFAPMSPYLHEYY